MPGVALDALDAFRRNLPQRTGPGGSGLWRRLVWGDTLELFVLDCRSERRDGDYVSREQMDWLKGALTASTARFKLLLNSVPITDMDSVYLGVQAEDRWDGYPEQRREILEHVTERGVTGVLWVSGDFHWGAVTRVGDEPEDPGFDQVEVFAGPGGSSINPLAYLVGEDDRYPAVVTEHNVVLIDADPQAGTLWVRFVAASGEILREATLRR